MDDYAQAYQIIDKVRRLHLVQDIISRARIGDPAIGDYAEDIRMDNPPVRIRQKARIGHLSFIAIATVHKENTSSAEYMKLVLQHLRAQLERIMFKHLYDKQQLNGPKGYLPK